MKSSACSFSLRETSLQEIASAEALVRWIREDGSVIFPDQFIPLFELNGFCAQLDLYMGCPGMQKAEAVGG